MTDPVLQTQWAVCGIAAATARFVPVPLLDDVVRRQAARVAVVRTVRAHGHDHPPDLLEALWEERDPARRGARGESCEGCPRRLAALPVPQVHEVFGRRRGVPDEVARVVLLGSEPSTGASSAVTARVPVRARGGDRPVRRPSTGRLAVDGPAPADGRHSPTGCRSAAPPRRPRSPSCGRRVSPRRTDDDGRRPTAPWPSALREVSAVLRRPRSACSRAHRRAGRRLLASRG
jgi:hypothetical protein